MKLRLDSKDDQLELMLHIKDLFDDGIIRTKDISENIGRSERQTKALPSSNVKTKNNIPY